MIRLIKDWNLLLQKIKDGTTKNKKNKNKKKKKKKKINLYYQTDKTYQI